MLRVLFCPGDHLFWRGAGGIPFRGRDTEWPGTVRDLLSHRGVTDLVCLGDGRPIHAEAITVAEELGIRVHVIEQGYLRPGWLTVEPGGTGGYSQFPRTSEAIRALATGEVGCAPRYHAGFTNYAAMDVAWNLANLFAGVVGYRHYRRHALKHVLWEWIGWLGKAFKWPVRSHRDASAMERALHHRGPLFLLALQLETDFQIRLHGPSGGQRPQLLKVLESFATSAPADALLVVKRHPLDDGITPWGRLIRKTASALGIADRCPFLTGGDLGQLLESCNGVVTVNSTVGLTALRSGVPVHALGRAIYRVAGLTDSGPLSDFWVDPRPPDAELCDALVDALAATIQVPGGFDGEGARPGADAMAERILCPVFNP